MRSILDDFRYGFRQMVANPGFATVAILTLAVGIGVSATVFSWIDGILLRPFGGAVDGARLNVLEMVTPSAPNGANQLSFLDYKDYRDQLHTVNGLAAHREEALSVGTGTDARTIWGEFVSGNYFQVLGLAPAAGRFFAASEQSDTAGANPVVVISDRLWASRFQRDPQIAGRSLRINRHNLTIVGVAPPEFHGSMPGIGFDAWIPLTVGVELGVMPENTFKNRAARSFNVLARLKPGVTLQQATVEAAAVAGRLNIAYPQTNRRLSAVVLPVGDAHSGVPALLAGPLRILLGACVLVLLIACANVANLLLARAVSRQREFGIRLAMGAGRWPIMRQLFHEALLLAAAGSAVGLLLAMWMGASLPALIPKVDYPVVTDYQLNHRILLFVMLLCSASALVAGMAPALLSLRANVNDALRQGMRSGGSSTHHHHLRGMLVVAEVALATVALTGAGLFLRSFENARNVNPGFSKENVLLAQFYFGGAGYKAEDVLAYSARLQERMRAVPGVEDASYADSAPLGTNAGPYSTIAVEGYTPAQGESMDINRTWTAPGYFRLMRIPLIEGRDFTEADARTSTPVMIVNQEFARRYYRGANPVGQRVRMFDRWFTVVGQVRDSKYFDAAEAPRPYFYAPMKQWYGMGAYLHFYVRGHMEYESVLTALRREASLLDPNAGSMRTMTLTSWTEVTLLPHKMAASLLSALGFISLFLAAIGLYSVMSYAVSQRTQEIGIRMALGARVVNVLQDVLRRGMALAAGGVALGVVAALTVTRLVSSMLVRVEANDPVIYAFAAVFLLGIALLALVLPARSAAKVDPLVALRGE